MGQKSPQSTELNFLRTLEPAALKSWIPLILPVAHEKINQILSLVFHSVGKRFILAIPKASQFELNGIQFVYKAIWFHPEVEIF